MPHEATAARRFAGGLGAALGLVSALAIGVSACGDEPAAPACVDVSMECAPVVQPQFDAIYANILLPTCASGTGACHGSYAAGGVDMQSADSAYASLSSRVDTSTPGCSLLLNRVESTNASTRMPPGPNPLSEAQRCAIRLWVRDGAQR